MARIKPHQALLFFVFVFLFAFSHADMSERLKYIMEMRARRMPDPGPQLPPPPAIPTFEDDPLFYVFENHEARRAPLNEGVWRFMRKHKYFFIGGQHRSGTSLVHYLLAAHSNVSGFTFGRGEHEGQHAQTVYTPDFHLEPVLSPDVSCGIREGIFPGTDFTTLNEFQIFMQYVDAHMTENSAKYVTPEANDRLWKSWNAQWDPTSYFRVEKSPSDLIRTRFLQAHFPESQFLLIARHPLAIAMPEVRDKSPRASHLANIRTHLQHFVLGWLWFVPEDVAHLNKVLVMRLEDILVDVQASYSAILDVLGVPKETISFQAPKPGFHAGRRPLFFHGPHKERMVDVNQAERTEWIPVWDMWREKLEAEGYKEQLKFVLNEFEPALNLLGYSAYPPYILSNQRMLSAFPTASWQAVVNRGADSFEVKTVHSGGQGVDLDQTPGILLKLALCRYEQQQQEQLHLVHQEMERLEQARLEKGTTETSAKVATTK